MKKNKLIKDTVHGYVSIEQELINIIDSAEFQRLKNIRQTSYSSLYPSSSHDRFTHSIGVLNLGKYALECFKRNVMVDFKSSKDSENEKLSDILNKKGDVFLLACLLHDVGHSPFSHTGENFYLKNHSNDGECYIYSELIAIINNESFTQQFTTSISSGKAAKPHEIMSAIVGIKKWLTDRNSDDKELFARMIIGLTYKDNSKIGNGISNALICLLNSSVIDVDKLDYLLRDKMMTGYEGINIDVKRLLSSVCLISKKKGTKNFYGLGYYKNALSVIENVVLAHDSERKWIQMHSVVIYDSFLVQKCIQAVESNFCKEKSTIFCEEAIGTEGINYNNYVFRLLSDADIIHLAKQIKAENEYYKYINEFFDRRQRKKAVWKSESEFDMTLREFSDNEREFFVEYLNELKDELKSWTDETENFFIVNDSVKKKILNENNKKIQELDDDIEINRLQALIMSLEKKFNLFQYISRKFNIDFDFVVIYNKRFSSNVEKFQKNEIMIQYKNFANPKSIADIISTYSLNKQSSIKDFPTVYYIFYNRKKESISPKCFVEEFVKSILRFQ